MSVLAACALTGFIFLWHWHRSGWGLVDYLGIGFWNWYARLWHRWSSNGQAPLPAQGPAILVSNHTCSADPSFLTAGCARRLSFLLAEEFYGFPLVARLFEFLHCVPVRRDGKDARSVRLSLRRLEEGRVLCIFPEGGLSHVGRKGPVVGKAGIAYIALKSRVPVYPALIRKGPQTSKVLDSWLKPSRGVRVTFGPPLDLSRFYDRPVSRKLLEEMTRYIMRRIHDLGIQEPRTKKP